MQKTVNSPTGEFESRRIKQIGSDVLGVLMGYFCTCNGSKGHEQNVSFPQLQRNTIYRAFGGGIILRQFYTWTPWQRLSISESHSTSMAIRFERR